MARKIKALLEDDGQFADHVGRDDGVQEFALGDLVAADPQERNLDEFAGFTFRDKLIADLDQVVDQIDSGRAQKITANNNITFTFLDEGDGLIGIYNNPKYGFTAGEGLAAFNDGQILAARDSIDLWDDLIAPSFVETKGRGADIQFANSTDPAQAYAYFPSEKGGYKFLGDVFIADPEVNWTNDWNGFGGYGKTTLVHEIGHTLGLSHPGAYNGGGATNYTDQAEYAQDSEQYSIMSYWSMAETSNQPFSGGAVDWTTLFFNNPQTPLLHDILTIQAKYGADPTTRADDTVYGWNSTAGKEVYDFSSNLYPYLSIYDAGGNDTIDMSGAGASVYINLNPGSFSSGAAEIQGLETINTARAELAAISGLDIAPLSQGTVDFYSTFVPDAHEGILEFETGVAGLGVTSHDNISIAYGTIIENAIGSSERDLLVGNDVANVLTGLGGDDVFEGGAGADIFVVGDGNDTILDFATGEDILDISGVATDDTSVTIGAGFVEVDVDGDAVIDFTIDTNGVELAATDVFYG